MIDSTGQRGMLHRRFGAGGDARWVHGHHRYGIQSQSRHQEIHVTRDAGRHHRRRLLWELQAGRLFFVGHELPWAGMCWHVIPTKLDSFLQPFFSNRRMCIPLVSCCGRYWCARSWRRRANRRRRSIDFRFGTWCQRIRPSRKCARSSASTASDPRSPIAGTMTRWGIYSTFAAFLDATTHLFKRSCLSVRWSVGPWVRPSVPCCFRTAIKWQ